ncbi:hypothetical protein [Cyclobacterium sp.]|uniref:hypothetical protein n=1 Tax=Cyclobacterium sp. TaxID=1966343 RepID=UPI001997EFC6|nr:hypothetical protein [Cyclobacterium sp.]MBD3627608.1 hypothetical protein [Cyclobacterium sp.]
MKNLIALLAFMVFLGGATWPIEPDPPADKVELSDQELCNECKLVMESDYEVPPAPEIYQSQAQPVNDADLITSYVAPEPEAFHVNQVTNRVDLHYDPGSCDLAMEWTSKTYFSV